MAVTAAELLVLVRAEGVEQTAASLLGLGEATSAAAMGATALAAAAALTVAGLAASTAEAANFQRSTMEIANNTTMATGQIDTMRSTILALGADSGVSFDILGQGFMRAMNITNDTATSMAILQVATESAASTGGNAAATTNILANAMHEYGLDVVRAADGTMNLAAVQANAAHVMGVMHLAAAEGNMTLEQFSDYSGRAIGIGANLGVSLEDVSAGFSSLTRHGFDAATAGTQMTNIMTHMINPTKAAHTELVKLSHATGIDLVGDFTAAGLSSKGLEGVLGDLKTAYEKMGYSSAQAEAESMKLIAAQRGGLGLATLLGTGYEDFTKTLADLNNQELTNGITEQSYNKIKETAGFQWDRLKRTVQEAAIVLGTSMLPALTGVLGGLQAAVAGALPFINTYGPMLAAAIGTGLTAILNFAGQVRTAIAAVLGAFQSLLSGQTSLSQFIGGMETWIGTILGKLGELAARAAPYIGQFFSAIGSAINTYGPQVVAQFQIWGGRFSEWIQTTAIPFLLPRLQAFGTAITSWITGTALPAIGTAAEGLATALSDWVKTKAIPFLQTNLPPWLAAITSWITGTALPAIGTAAEGLATALSDWVKTKAIPALEANLPGIASAIATGLATALTNIDKFSTDAGVKLNAWIKTPETQAKLKEWNTGVGSALDGVSTTVNNWGVELHFKIGDKFSEIGTTIRDRVTRYKNDTGQQFSDLGTAIRDKLTTIKNDVGTKFSEIGTTIHDRIAKYLTDTGQQFSDLGTAIRDKLTTIKNDVGEAFSSLGTTVSDKMNTVKSDVTTAFEGVITAARDAMTRMKEAVATGITTVVSTLGGLKDKAVGAVGDLSSALLGAGASLVQGFINGIESKIGDAQAAAGKLAGLVSGGITDHFIIKSPSVLMHRHGQAVAQGLTNGIASATPAAAKAAADLSVAVAKGITDTLAAMHLLSTYDFATGSPSGGQFAMLGTLTAQMVATIQDAAKGFGDAGLKAATTFADAAAKVGTMVKSALTGLQDLANFDFAKNTPTAQQLGMLTTLTVSLVQTIQDAAAQFNDLGLKSATTFAEAAGKVGGMVKNALAGLSELANFDFAKGSPTGAQLGMLTTLVVSLVRSIQDAATSFDAAGLKAATTFSDAAAKVGGMVKNALAGLKELAAFDFAGGTPTADQLGVFAASVAAVVRAIEDAAAGFTGPGLAAATAFSDAASKALGIIKTGVAGLTALATFTAPSAAAIDAFVVAVRELVAKFAVAAASIGTDGVTAATAFGTAANTAVHTIKTGIDAFKAFKDMRVPSAEAIDTLVVAVTYVVGKFRDMADAMGHDALTKAQAFGTAVETIAKSVQTAIGTFKSLTEPPFKGALTKIMTEFNGDFDGALAMMIEAHGKAAQFETEARMYKEAMLNAATSIAAGNAALANAALPGSSLGRDMKAAGQNLGDALHDAVRDTLQIKSPSQVMVTVGRQVVAGLVGGMSSTQQDAVKKAAELAKAVADAVIVTLTSLRALGNLNSAALPSGDQVGGFLASTMQVVDAVAAAASAMNGKALDAAVKFAAGAGKVLGFVGSAVTALTGLAALTPPAASAIYAFDKTLRLLVNDFALTAEQVGTDMLGLATTFSTGAGAVADAVGKGVAGLTKLASYVDPAPAAIYALGKTLRLAIQDFAALAALVGKDMLAEATSLADGAGKVADTVGKGVAGLGKLVDYVAPPAAAVYALGKTIRLLVADFAALADLLGNDASASAGRFAESAGKVVGIIGNAVDGFVKLGTYNGIANTLIGPFVETVRTLITAIGQAAAQFTTEGLTLAGRFADTAAKAVGILSNGVDGFTKLRDYNGVGDAAIEAFVATVTTLLRGIAQASTQFSAKGLDLAGKFADTAGKVVGLLVSGVAGFAELAKFTTPTSAAIGEFIRVLTDITSRFTWYVPTFAKGQLAAAQLFAETAGKVIGIIGTGVAGFAALATLVTPSSAAIGEFIRVATDMTSRFTWYVPTFAKGQLAAASLFAETAGKVTAIIGTGVAGFAALAGFVAPSNDAIAEFVRVLTDITSRVAWYMPNFATGQLVAAQLFAETAGKVTAIIGGGVAGFNALADFRAPTMRTLDEFAWSVGQIVARLVNVAGWFDTNGVTAAGAFADSAGKILAIVGSGVQGLTSLFAFVAPPTAALDAFAASVQGLVARFGWLAATLRGDGLAAAQTFATAAGAVFGALTSATGFFKSLDNLLLPDLAGINRILAPITATIDAVLGVAARFGTAGLTAAQQFAATVSAIFGAMQTATTALGRPGGTGGLGLPATGGGGYSGGGGGLTVNLTFNAPIMGIADFNNAVVTAVVEAERRGRL